MSLYTLGIWTVKPGREEEFIQAWRDLATRTRSEFPGSSARLLRDRDNPHRFISSGPWQSLEQIQTWRASTTFKDGVGKIRELLDSFEAHTMDETLVIG